MAHICLQPIALLGLCWIANGWERLPPVVRRVVIIGRALEVGLGIMLQTYLQGIDLRGAGLGLVARQNARLKWNKEVSFLGDSVAGVLPVLIIAIVAIPLLVLGYAYTRWRADERSE